MKPLVFLLLSFIATSLFANDAVHKFASSEECKACHTEIYAEFSASMHANSTPQKDPVHAAVWNKHPKNLKLIRFDLKKNTQSDIGN